MCYNKYKRKVGHLVNTFSINGNNFSIRLSSHAEMRLKQRNIDLFQTVGNILSLGEKRIMEYSHSDRDIMVMDKRNNFSMVFYIDNCTIYIITVIDKVDCYVKEGTTAINI